MSNRLSSPTEGAPKSICVLYRHNHISHVIIQRQIRSFLGAGFNVTVLDQAGEECSDGHRGYSYVRVRHLGWGLLVRALWAFIRRVGSPTLNDWFWSAVLRLRFLSNALMLTRAAVRQRADWYIAHDLWSAWAALKASQLLGRPVVYDAHEIESEQGAGEAIRIQQPFLRSLEERVIPRVDRLIVPNGARGHWYQENYGTRRDPVVVRNCPPAQIARDSDKLRSTLELDRSVRIVLYHGALIPYRALDNLVRSAALFDDGIVLVFIGEQGDYYHDLLRPLATEEQVLGPVFFLPYVEHDQVLSYVASADLGVVIYQNVNMNNYLCAPTKLYEYIMMKVPVVACGFPGLAEFMERYPVGNTFDPEDPSSIADAVNAHFAADPAERALTEQALSEAGRRFNWETESQKWLGLLNGRLTG